MKLSILVFFVFNIVSPDLKKIREHFTLMSTNEDSITAIKELSLKSKEVSAILKSAYYAAAEMSSAQYKINPASKLKAFNTGKKILEATIAADTNNIEARYIRYTIQKNAPSFLGYNKSILNDKCFLIEHLNSVKLSDPELFSNVYAYLLTYCELTAKQKGSIAN